MELKGINRREFIEKAALGLSLIVILTLISMTNLLATEAQPVGELTQNKEILRSLLPKVSEVSGWKISSPPRLFEPYNLWEYINGQAEMYLDYGFRLVVTSDYGSKENSSSLAIEIYQMESPTHAFAIYAAERSPQDKFVKIGVQGYIAENILNFWKGPYYVKLTSFQSSPTTERSLLKLSREIADKITGNYAEPELFSCFPEKNKVKMSERFIPRNFLGHSFLKNGYWIDYEREGNRYQAFLAKNSSEEEAEEAFGKYQDFLKSQGEIISKEKKTGCQKIRAKNNKKRILFQYKSTIGGVLNIDDFSEGEEIIEKILSELRLLF